MRGVSQGSVNELFKTQLMILSKLFIIMGIPWTCDIVSAAVTHTDDLGETFQLRLMLDILNLLTGVLIFLALVCKKSVFESLRSKFLGKCKYSPGEENTNNQDG